MSMVLHKPISVLLSLILKITLVWEWVIYVLVHTYLYHIHHYIIIETVGDLIVSV